MLFGQTLATLSSHSTRHSLHDWTRNGFENISPFPPGLVMAVSSPLRRVYMGDAMADAITFECPDPRDCPACHQLSMNYTSILAKVHFRLPGTGTTSN